MIKYAKIINEETKQCDVGIGTNTEFYKSIGMSEMDVEQANNEEWYIVGYIPQTAKEESVRKVRQEYFEKYVDWYQSKPLLWAEMDEIEKKNISDYRIYLMDYTKIEGWYNKNPKTYEEWLENIPQEN